MATIDKREPAQSPGIILTLTLSGGSRLYVFETGAGQIGVTATAADQAAVWRLGNALELVKGISDTEIERLRRSGGIRPLLDISAKAAGEGV